MSDEISVERLREIAAEVESSGDDPLVDEWRNAAIQASRLALRLRAEVERLTAEIAAAAGLLSVARSLAEENANERDECESALHRLAKRAGVPDDGPDEIVNAVLETIARLKAVAGSGAREMDRETIEVLVRQRNDAEARAAELERALRRMRGRTIPFQDSWQVPLQAWARGSLEIIDAALAAPAPVRFAGVGLTFRRAPAPEAEPAEDAEGVDFPYEVIRGPDGILRWHKDGVPDPDAPPVRHSDAEDAEGAGGERCGTCGFVDPHKAIRAGGITVAIVPNPCPDCQPEGEGSQP